MARGRACCRISTLGDADDFGHPEALAYIDGIPYADCDRYHQEFILPPQWCNGDEHLLALHGWTGRGEVSGCEPGTQLFMRPCALVRVDQATRAFLATARVALGVANSLEENDPAKAQLLNALEEALRLLDTREPLAEAFYASVPAAHAALTAGIALAGPLWRLTSSPLVTPIWTWRGIGPWGRPGARPGGPSIRSFVSWSKTAPIIWEQSAILPSILCFTPLPSWNSLEDGAE